MTEGQSEILRVFSVWEDPDSILILSYTYIMYYILAIYYIYVYIIFMLSICMCMCVLCVYVCVRACSFVMCVLTIRDSIELASL